MRGIFSGAKDDFWRSNAKRAVMIHLGKSKIFKRKGTEVLQRVIGRKLA